MPMVSLHRCKSRALKTRGAYAPRSRCLPPSRGIPKAAVRLFTSQLGNIAYSLARTLNFKSINKDSPSGINISSHLHKLSFFSSPSSKNFYSLQSTPNHPSPIQLSTFNLHHLSGLYLALLPHTSTHTQPSSTWALHHFVCRTLQLTLDLHQALINSFISLSHQTST